MEFFLKEQIYLLAKYSLVSNSSKISYNNLEICIKKEDSNSENMINKHGIRNINLEIVYEGY